MTKKPIEIIYLVQKRLAYIKGKKFTLTLDDFIHTYQEHYDNTDAKELETVLFVE